MTAISLLVLFCAIVATVWSAARSSARAEHDRDMARLAKDAEDMANEIRRDIAREPDAVERLQDDWTRD